MSQFHTDDYVDFLNRVTPDNVDAYVREQAKCVYQALLPQTMLETNVRWFRPALCLRQGTIVHP